MWNRIDDRQRNGQDLSDAADTEMKRSPFTLDGDGLCLAIRLTPRASRTGLDGVRDDGEGRPVLCLRVAAPPVEGAANTALTALIAKSLGLRKADIAFVSGESSRIKRLRLSGDPADLAARLEAWIGGAARSGS